jgi:hypothetical protein
VYYFFISSAVTREQSSTLNSVYENIQFIMQTERASYLPFLDIDTYRKPDGFLDHKVYRKSTHTNSSSHHHPPNRPYAPSSYTGPDPFVCRVEFLRTTFRQNGYSDRQIRRALNPLERVTPSSEKPASVGFLSYVSTTFKRISRLLSKHNIKSVGLLPKQIPSFLRPVKDDLELKTPGVYSVACGCVQVYIGQTGRSIETRIMEHQRYIRLKQPDKSASTWATALRYRTPPSSPPKRHTWTG